MGRIGPAAGLMGLLMLILSSAALGCSTSQQPEAKASTMRATPIAASAALSATDGSSVADVVEGVLPSVVSITSTKHVRSRSPMELFFGGPSRGRPAQGLGSGVILSVEGLVVTNNHVIEGADEIEIRTSDNRDFEAKLIGTDPKSDLAVLQIQGDDLGELTPIRIGDSASLRLGDVVLAVGNPFGVGQTVTMGIVSATGRSELGIVDYENFIQTDAAINPGNSGGALVNLRGELVGINTAILSRSGGSMGIGFAIPTNMAGPIVDALRTNGEVSRGWLGVSIQEIDSDLRQALGVQRTGGVLIADVLADGPAERAGLISGDVVTHVDGKTVDSPGHFRNLIAHSQANKKVKLSLLREGKSKTMSVELGTLPEKGEDGRMGSSPQKSETTLEGLALSDLTDDLRQRLDVEAGLDGAVVLKVAPGSKAAAAGLRPGDVILQVNRQKVGSAEAFERSYKNAQGARLLQILRRGVRQFVVIK